MKYPKPGYNNPLVSVHIFDVAQYQAGASATTTGFPATQATLELDWKGRHPVKDSVITEVTWVANDTLIVKESNRNADDGNVVLFELGGNDAARFQGRVVRKLGKNGEEGDSGWIECVRMQPTLFTASNYGIRCRIYVLYLKVSWRLARLPISTSSLLQTGTIISRSSALLTLAHRNSSPRDNGK
jgi:hypothetical protein